MLPKLPPKFGIYVHIPYCLQRCTYCDFATYAYNPSEPSQILPPADYVQLLLREIDQQAESIQKQAHRKQLSTVYFGGGTPSLIPAELIVAVLEGLTSKGFRLDQNTEITLEINPATVDPQKMRIYRAAGVNRFSVGAQTFNDALLKSVRREHNAEQTRATLELLRSEGVNFSFDILFALPKQTLDILRADLQEVVHFKPNHVSPYCLTVPEGHVLSKVRPPEENQLEMFALLHQKLTENGYERYEISNYCLPGFESKHNSLYWSDDEYWGLGLSSHSYLHEGLWGKRFWNANAIGAYEKQIEAGRGIPEEQVENLLVHQALTDFCHTALRTKKGLELARIDAKFGPKISSLLQAPLAQLVDQSLLQAAGSHFALTDQGVLLSNQVFGALTFLQNEVPQP